MGALLLSWQKNKNKKKNEEAFQARNVSLYLLFRRMESFSRDVTLSEIVSSPSEKRSTPKERNLIPRKASSLLIE